MRSRTSIRVNASRVDTRLAIAGVLARPFGLRERVACALLSGVGRPKRQTGDFADMIAVGNQIGGWTVAAARALDGDAELIRLVRGGTSLGFVIAPDGATICRLDVDVAGGGTLLGSGIRARATAVLAGAVSERAASFRHYGTQTGASTVPLRDAARRRT